MIAQHGVERGPCDLGELADLRFGEAGGERLRSESPDRGGLLGGLLAGPGAGAAVSAEGPSEFVHDSSVKYLTKEVQDRKVLSMTYRITTQAQTRSKSRRTRTWEIQAATADDAIFEARINHVRVCGWNVSIWIDQIEEVA